MHHKDDNQQDAMLVVRVLAGEREAFGPLLDRYYGSVVRMCQRLLGAGAEAQDIVQEAALYAFLQLDRLQEPARFGAWFHAIAANLARMALRRRRIFSLDALDEGARLTVLWSQNGPTPEEVQIVRETHDAIIAELKNLSVVNREVVIGFYLEGYTYSELAVLLGVPASTVKGRLFKGRRQLQQTLKPVAFEILKPDRRKLKEWTMAIETPELVEVKIDSIRVDETQQHHVLILIHEASNRGLPIWIGSPESFAIAMVLEDKPSARPMAHELTLRLLEPAGVQIQQVVVNALVEDTFYAEISLKQGEHTYRVDARPSDAIALAVRTSVPIFVARSVMEAVGGPNDDTLLERAIEHFKQWQAAQTSSQSTERTK